MEESLFKKKKQTSNNNNNNKKIPNNNHPRKTNKKPNIAVGSLKLTLNLEDKSMQILKS